MSQEMSKAGKNVGHNPRGSVMSLPWKREGKAETDSEKSLSDTSVFFTTRKGQWGWSSFRFQGKYEDWFVFWPPSMDFKCQLFRSVSAFPQCFSVPRFLRFPQDLPVFTCFYSVVCLSPIWVLAFFLSFSIFEWSLQPSSWL